MLESHHSCFRRHHPTKIACRALRKLSHTSFRTMSMLPISRNQEQRELSSIGVCEGNRALLSPVEPCYLPARNEGPNNVVSRKAIEVQVPHQSNLTRLPIQHDVTVMHVVQAAWALTLQRYVGSNTVTFGFLSLGSSEIPTGNGEMPRTKVKHSQIYDGIVASIISTDITGTESVLDVIRSMAVRSSAWLECGEAQHPFNTAVIYRRMHPQSSVTTTQEDPDPKVGIRLP